MAFYPTGWYCFTLQALLLTKGSVMFPITSLFVNNHLYKSSKAFLNEKNGAVRIFRKGNSQP